jgi:thiamine-phosphate pyrophosphorylase
MKTRLTGLYAITDTAHTGIDDLESRVRAALDGGARVIQYRDKTTDTTRRHREASRLVELCRAYRVPLLVNDDVELALAVGADGVHLGREDAGLDEARRRLPADALIGCSCYNRFDLAERAAAHGADYVAFGSFFASPTKPRAVPASPDLLRRARDELDLPAVAIGGITPENGAALVDAGAAMLAVISAVFDAPDITRAARAFAPCFRLTEETD